MKRTIKLTVLTLALSMVSVAAFAQGSGYTVPWQATLPRANYLQLLVLGRFGDHPAHVRKPEKSRFETKVVSGLDSEHA